MTPTNMASPAHIVICVKGGLVELVLSDTPDIEVEVMDWDVLDDGHTADVTTYLANRLDLLTPASREAAVAGEYNDLQIDTTKFPHILY